MNEKVPRILTAEEKAELKELKAKLARMDSGADGPHNVGDRIEILRRITEITK